MISRISEDEIAEMKVSSLPTRPTAPTAFGGRGYTATDMKQAFDKLPLYLVKKYNELIDAITAVADESIIDLIPSGLGDDHMCGDVIRDMRSGALSYYLMVFEKSLAEHIATIGADISAIKRDMGDSYTAREFVVLDCGKPYDRIKGGDDYAE